MVKPLMLILSIVIITLACNRSADNFRQSGLDSVNANVQKIDTDSLLLAIANQDTLQIRGRHIVFFSLSQPEYDAYPKGPDSGIDEVLSDFNYYAGEVADSLRTLGFGLTATASRFIQISLPNDSTYVFDRLADPEHVVGRIYLDSAQVKISYGVATDIDIFAELDELN